MSNAFVVALGLVSLLLEDQDPLFLILLWCSSSVARLFYSYTSTLRWNWWLPSLLMWVPWGLCIGWAAYQTHLQHMTTALPYWLFFGTAFLAEILVSCCTQCCVVCTMPTPSKATESVTHAWVFDTIAATVPLAGVLIYELYRTFNNNEWWIAQSALTLVTLIVLAAVLAHFHRHCGVVRPARALIWVLGLAALAIPVAAIILTRSHSLFGAGLLNSTLCIFVMVVDRTRPITIEAAEYDLEAGDQTPLAKPRVTQENSDLFLGDEVLVQTQPRAIPGAKAHLDERKPIRMGVSYGSLNSRPNPMDFLEGSLDRPVTNVLQLGVSPTGTSFTESSLHH